MKQSQIRNFSIIAHIDHGKTTLTDQFLKLTKTVTADEKRERIMDSNPIEQERGVTIKLAPVRMTYQGYTLNLIDTPGHVDFGYEVSRSLQACEAALLLVDATQGVQAQTLANFEKARQLGLSIIPVVNKIDLPTADIETTMLEMIDTFELEDEQILNCSAKTGQGVEAVLQAIITHCPPPSYAGLNYPALKSIGAENSDAKSSVQTQVDKSKPAKQLKKNPVKKNSAQNSEQKSEQNLNQTSAQKAGQTLDQLPLKALIITSKYDNHQGAIAYVRVMSGQLKPNTDLHLLHADCEFQPNQIGVFTPQATPVEVLSAGGVGYVATGLKDIEQLKIGDTIVGQQAHRRHQLKPLPGFREPTPMVFMELYPIQNDQFQDLKDAMAKLTLHDSALQYQATHSQALGNGLRVGFLGIFHAEVVRERLQREFDLQLIATAPAVKYRIKTKKHKNQAEAESIEAQTVAVESPADLPKPHQIEQILEPITRTTIFAPVKYLPDIVEFTRRRRGQLLNSKNNGARARLEYRLPLSELIVNFHDQLKSLTSGFASLEYQVVDYQPVDAVKVDILVNKEPVEALSFICLRQQAETKGRKLVEKLKEVIPQQLFSIPIQAAIGGKIIARETVKALRKDVTAKLYGGDRTRRMKLLKQQAEGKKRMKQFGEVELNQDAFLAVLQTD